VVNCTCVRMALPLYSEALLWSARKPTRTQVQFSQNLSKYGVADETSEGGDTGGGNGGSDTPEMQP